MRIDIIIELTGCGAQVETHMKNFLSGAMYQPVFIASAVSLDEKEMFFQKILVIYFLGHIWKGIKLSCQCVI